MHHQQVFSRVLHVIQHKVDLAVVPVIQFFKTHLLLLSSCLSESFRFHFISFLLESPFVEGQHDMP